MVRCYLVSMKTNDLLQVLQTVLLAAAVALLVVREEPVVAGAGFGSGFEGDPAWSRLEESLSRLTGVLDQRAPATRGGVDGVEHRRPIAAGDPVDLDPLVAQLRRLEIALRGVRGVADRTPAVVSMREQYSRTDWPKLKPLYQQYRQMSEDDKEGEFKRDFLLLSLSDVLRRFGKPTSIETSGAEQAWQYSLEDEKGDETLVDLTFVISNGFVVNVH